MHPFPIGSAARAVKLRVDLDSRVTGTHLMANLVDTDSLDDLPLIEGFLEQCADVLDSEMLHLHLHPFEGGGGISGVALMPKSHVSIHTWPEYRFGALDVFVRDVRSCDVVLRLMLGTFRPKRLNVERIIRGGG